jgi:hypothetical protein
MPRLSGNAKQCYWSHRLEKIGFVLTVNCDKDYDGLGYIATDMGKDVVLAEDLPLRVGFIYS